LDPNGLHARPAALIARIANQFEANIVVQPGKTVANGRSLIALLTLCAGPGEHLTIIAEGIDADRSMDVLEGLAQQHAFMIRA
jgi:phosphotransferase system HPr (HPr) family protein